MLPQRALEPSLSGQSLRGHSSIIANCKLQISNWKRTSHGIAAWVPVILHFAFCILHFAICNLQFAMNFAFFIAQ